MQCPISKTLQNKRHVFKRNNSNWKCCKRSTMRTKMKFSAEKKQPNSLTSGINSARIELRSYCGTLGKSKSKRQPFSSSDASESGLRLKKWWRFSSAKLERSCTVGGCTGVSSWLWRRFARLPENSILVPLSMTGIWTEVAMPLISPYRWGGK